LPPAHPLQTLLREAPDFRNEAALADALLHPRDRSYSVPQFFDFLDSAALRFGRWVRQAPYSACTGDMEKIPQAARIARLSPQEQFAAVELFRGTMVRHSAIVYRDDGTNRLPRIDFDGGRWLDYVPIRLPETICVQERLPAGAAAVLINQTHTYRDLYLPITASEKRLFDAIEGNRSIADTMEHAWQPPHQAASRDAARVFFERLWRYDQIVFDASRAYETLAT
jgi:hypothetical protein